MKNLRYFRILLFMHFVNFRPKASAQKKRVSPNPVDNHENNDKYEF